MNSISEVVKLAKGRPSLNKRFIIAVSGFGGSGKTTISDQLSKQLDNALVIHVDDFIATDSTGAKESFIHDWDALENLVFKKLQNETKVVTRIYDWDTNKQVHEEQELTPYAIVEGPPALLQDKYANYYDLGIWLDVEQQEANSRGKKRDKEVYKIDHDELWDTVWSPREMKFFKENRPDLKADIRIPNEKQAL